jgi:Flp pilus assembly protein protease CpaA
VRVYHRGPSPVLRTDASGAAILASDVILYGALLIAAVWDARTKRIPNWLTFTLMLAALIYQALAGEGMLFALEGLGAAFVLHFALWQMKLEGAGDAKLMMGVGAFVGWATMLEATAWRYVLLVPYAIVAITAMGRWQNFLAAVLWSAEKARGMPVGERPEPAYMPFGPLIAVAVPLAMRTAWLDFVG